MAKQSSNIENTKGGRWPAAEKVETEVVLRLLGDYRSPFVCSGGPVTTSRDASPEGLQSIVRIENFMNRVSKSDQTAVVLDKSSSGISSRKYTPLGKELHQLLAYPRFIPPQMQPGEGFKLFDAVVQTLNVSQAVFAGNPMHIICPSVFFDSDSLNAVMTQLQKGTRCKHFKRAQEQRKMEAQLIANSQTRLVDRLHEFHANLFGTYVELMYDPESVHDVTLADSSQHLERLIELIKDDPMLGKAVGHFWSRSYSSEYSYRIRLCLLFDERVVPIRLVNYGRIYKYWVECTQGLGVVSALPFNSWPKKALLMDIHFSAKKTRYLRLIPSNSHPHFGVSDLPHRKSLKCATDHLTGRFQ